MGMIKSTPVYSRGATQRAQFALGLAAAKQAVNEMNALNNDDPDWEEVEVDGLFVAHAYRDGQMVVMDVQDGAGWGFWVTVGIPTVDLS